MRDSQNNVSDGSVSNNLEGDNSEGSYERVGLADQAFALEIGGGERSFIPNFAMNSTANQTPSPNPQSAQHQGEREQKNDCHKPSR